MFFVIEMTDANIQNRANCPTDLSELTFLYRITYKVEVENIVCSRLSRPRYRKLVKFSIIYGPQTFTSYKEQRTFGVLCCLRWIKKLKLDRKLRKNYI